MSILQVNIRFIVMDVKNKIMQLQLHLDSGGCNETRRGSSYRRMARSPEAQTREIISVYHNNNVMKKNTPGDIIK